MCNYCEEIEVSTEICKVCGREYHVTETFNHVRNACSIEQGDTDGDTAPVFRFNTDCSGKYAEELSDLYDSSEDYLVDGILHCGYCGQPYTECMF